MVRLSARNTTCCISASNSTRVSTAVKFCVLAALSFSAFNAHADTSNLLQRLDTSQTRILEPARTLEFFKTQPPQFIEIASTPVAQARPVFGTLGTPVKTNEVKAEETKAGRFRKALRERDISFGYSRKIRASRFEGRSDVEFYQLLPRWGRFRNERQEFLWEVPITYATSPENAYAAGLTLMFRHHLSSRRSFSPFVEIGSGIVFTNFDKFPELGGSFQFTPQAGIGFRKSFGKSGDLVASARFFHMSNAGLKNPNTGLNNYLLTVGYSKLF